MKKNKIIISIAALALSILVLLLFLNFQNDDSQLETNDTREVNTVDYGPPTEEEQSSGDAAKQDIVERQETVENQPTDASVEVVISDASQYGNTIEVRSFMPKHYEDGTCKITFTNGENTVTKETPAYKDATTTICTNPLISRSEFPKSGEWNVSVAYTSKSGISGKSTIKKVMID